MKADFINSLHCINRHQVASHLSFSTSIKIAKICKNRVDGTNQDFDFAVEFSLGAMWVTFRPNAAQRNFIQQFDLKFLRCNLNWFPPKRSAVERALGCSWAQSHLGREGPPGPPGPLEHPRPLGPQAKLLGGIWTEFRPRPQILNPSVFDEISSKYFCLPPKQHLRANPSVQLFQKHRLKF
jgi:hypothetical protein